MPTYTFQSYPAVAVAKFTCPSCGKKNRKRTFRHECTASPFNKREDGMVRTPREVFQQSKWYAQREHDEFLREPLCATCEAALSFPERKALRERRRSGR